MPQMVIYKGLTTKVAVFIVVVEAVVVVPAVVVVAVLVFVVFALVLGVVVVLLVGCGYPGPRGLFNPRSCRCRYCPCSCCGHRPPARYLCTS